jgi:LAS superfamily LD-carboxypeptidase LdcB
MTKYPVLKIIMPTKLEGFANGLIPDTMLRPVKGGGQLEAHAATAWGAMQLAAYFDGIDLSKNVGAYRSLMAQKALFQERYSPLKTDRVPEVTRTLGGKTWYLKKGMAPAGTPGNSSHGWGLAVDVASASGSRLKWLLGDGFLTCNALKYGFSWQVSDPKDKNFEAWHLQYFAGDKLPQAVVEAIDAFPDLDLR